MKPSQVKVGMRVLMHANGKSHFGNVKWLRHGGCSVLWDDGEQEFFDDVNCPWAQFTEVEAGEPTPSGAWFCNHTWSHGGRCDDCGVQV